MKEKNIIFAIASGRSIDGLNKAFGNLAPEMTFISDNGARIYHKGNLLFEEGLELEDYKPFLEEMRNHEGLLPIACGRERKWIENNSSVTERAKNELLNFIPDGMNVILKTYPKR